MRSAPIIRFPPREARPLVTRVRLAARRLEADDRARGRAWINGREVGGTDQRFAHLARSYD